MAVRYRLSREDRKEHPQLGYIADYRYNKNFDPHDLEEIALRLLDLILEMQKEVPPPDKHINDPKKDKAIWKT